MLYYEGLGHGSLEFRYRDKNFEIFKKQLGWTIHTISCGTAQYQEILIFVQNSCMFYMYTSCIRCLIENFLI